MLSVCILGRETRRRNCPLRRSGRRLFGAPLLSLSLFAALFVLPASARELHIRDFHAELDVLPDSSLDVTETIRVEFTGAWQGIYRTIPVEYDGPGGFNYSLFVTDISATDSDGSALRIEKQRRTRRAISVFIIVFATACASSRTTTNSIGT
jgi:hypothetical protein